MKSDYSSYFPAKKLFLKTEAGTRTEEQIIAANVDYLFLVNALNHDFNVRRMERYLLLAYESGAMPVIVLTKSSICNDVEEKIVETEAIAIGVPIFVVDSLEHTGIDSLKQFVSSGKTIALVGSSGVGKSTLLNALIGIDVAKREIYVKRIVGGIRQRIENYSNCLVALS